MVWGTKKGSGFLNDGFGIRSQDLFYNCFEIGSWYVAQTGLELGIFLPQPSESWDYRIAPLCLPVKVFKMYMWFKICYQEERVA